MESRTLLVTAVAIIACMSVVACSVDVCPKNGTTWDADKDDHGDVRCILRCPKGYVPSGCHVIRPDGGSYNIPVPYCMEEPGVSGRSIVAVGIGIEAAVVVAPIAILAAGFTGAGVAAGSLAASLQGSTTAAGGFFALLQSAGVLGTAYTTKAGSMEYATTVYVMATYTGCEPE